MDSYTQSLVDRTRARQEKLLNTNVVMETESLYPPEVEAPPQALPQPSSAVQMPLSLENDYNSINVNINTEATASRPRKRFAQLAATINNWEDDLGGYVPSHRFPATPKMPTPPTEEDEKASPCPSPTKRSFLPIEKKVTNSPVKREETVREPLKLNQAMERNPLPEKKPMDEVPKALPNRSEAEPNESKKRFIPALQMPKNRVLNQAPLLSKVEKVDDKASKSRAVDPADLSLASRRELFERKILTGPMTRWVDSPQPEKLSVSAKANLFEKAIEKETSNAKSTYYGKNKLDFPKKVATLHEEEVLHEPHAKKAKSDDDEAEGCGQSLVKQMQKKLLTPTKSEELEKEREARETQAAIKMEAAKEVISHVEDVLENSNGDQDDQNNDHDQAMAAFQEIDDYSISSSESERQLLDNYPPSPYCYDVRKSHGSESFSTPGKYCSQSTTPSSVRSVASTSSSSRLYPELPSVDECEVLHSSPTKAYIPSCAQTEMANAASPVDVISSREPVKVSTPMRTLSQYRREQKQHFSEPVATSKLVYRSSVTPGSSSEEDEETKCQRIKETRRRQIAGMDKEVKQNDAIIAQTKAALNLCIESDAFRGSTERVEAEKLLLVTSLKRVALLNTISNIKKAYNIVDPKEPVRGHFSLTSIKVPIKNDAIMAQAKGLGQFNQYFMCIVSNGAKVIATNNLQLEGALQSGYLLFDTKCSFEELSSNFKVLVEIYGLAIPKLLEKRDHKHNSLRKKGKGKSAPSPARGSPAVAGPSTGAVNTTFTLLGSVTLALRNVTNKTHDLERFDYTCPLQGVIQMQLNISAEHTFSLKSFLNFYEESNGIGVWKRRWCVLRGFELIYWPYQEDEGEKAPLGIINMKQCVNPAISVVSPEVCARKHTFLLLTVSSKNAEETRVNFLINKNYKTMVMGKHLVSADLAPERDAWLQTLNKVLKSVRCWEPDALQPCDATQIHNFMK